VADYKIGVTIAGDSSSFERATANVGGAAKRMAGDLDSAEGKAKSFGGAMDAAGGAADASESKFMGAADLLDGLGGAFGLPTEGATNLMRSFGDLSGGFASLQPMIGGIGAAFKAFSATLITPPMGIILLIGGLVAALVLAYQKSETFRNIVSGAFNTVKNAVVAVWDFIRTLPEKIVAIGGTIKDALVWPFKTAFNLVSKAWNNTAGRLSFQVPSWVPGLGGKGFAMPKLPEFHTGGIVPGPAGAPVPILAMAGERIIPAGATGTVGRGGTGGITVIVQGSVITERDLGRVVADALRSNALIGVTI
jgi:hypothetical protein